METTIGLRVWGAMKLEASGFRVQRVEFTVLASGQQDVVSRSGVFQVIV